MPSLELICFGPPAANVGGQAAPTDVMWRKHFALLTYLALSPGAARTRDHLIGLLWPEKDQTRARRSFNEAVRRLRISLGAQRIVSTGATVSLSTEDLRVDAVEVAAPLCTDPLGLLKGDFLEGWAIEDAPVFEEWASAQRRNFQALDHRLSLDAAQAALEGMDNAAATNWAQRALNVDHYSEKAARLLMLSQAQAGDASRALASFGEFATRLAKDLGQEPSSDLSRLRTRIESGEVSQSPSAPGDAPADPPLVGRSGLHKEILGHVSRGLEIGPRAAVITGGPGTGRSRLMEECLRRASLEGAVTAVARPLESDHDAPYSTLRMLLQNDLSAAPGVLGADPDALGVLACIEPQFAPHVSPIEPRDSSHVATALRACVEAIGEEQPLAIAIDDAQYADTLTLAVLRAALRSLEGTPLVLVLTAPPATEDVPKELLSLRSALGRELQGCVVELTPLEVEDVEQLIVALAPWCEEPVQRNRLARRLTFETEGSPLFIVTLLNALREESRLREDMLVWPIPSVTFSAPLPIRIPDVVRAAIAVRLDGLDESAAQILKVASLYGQIVLPELMAATLDMSMKEVNRAIIVLEKAGFVSFRGDRATVAAPLIALAIRKLCLTLGERRQYRAKAVEVLEKFPEMCQPVDRASILAEAGRNNDAFKVAMAAASTALETGAHRVARRSLDLAERVSGEHEIAEVRELAARLERRGDVKT